MNLSYTLREDDFSAEENILQQGLDDHNKQSGLPTDHDLGAFCHDSGRLIGGVTGQIVGDRLLVKTLWVDPAYRHRNIAAELLDRLEKSAIADKCMVALVNTYSFQAPEFYHKCGYDEVARVTEYFQGHDRIFYRKELA